MSTPTPQAQIDAANAYETLMVPALFGEWASKVADAAGIQPGQRVLDVACGTGVLSREVAARTGPGGAVAGLDPVAGMLEVAKRLAPGVEWRQGVAESLPFPDRSFDIVADGLRARPRTRGSRHADPGSPHGQPQAEPQRPLTMQDPMRRCPPSVSSSVRDGRRSRPL